MLERRGIRVLVGVLCVAAASPAAAYHEEGREIVTDTAYTLRKGEVRLGIWRFDVGITDPVDVGTYTLLWLVPFPNVQGKIRVWHEGRWAFAVRSGLYYLNLAFVPWGDRNSDAQIGIFPFELYFSLPLAARFGLTLASVSTALYLQGAYDPAEFEGAAVVDSQQFELSIDWRTSRIAKLVLAMRWLVAERARGDAVVVRHLDEFTTLEIAGAGSIQAESVRDAGYLMLSCELSWEKINLRAGIGAGNYNVPAIGVMLPDKGLFADFDLFWRF